MNIKFNVRDIVDSSVQGMHCVYAKLIVDIPAMLVSYFVVNFTKITADTITYMGAMFAAISAFYVFSDNTAAAALWFYFAFVCDFMDGKIARMRKTSSHFGKKLDLAFDRLIFCGLTLTYVYYFETTGMHQEKMLLIIYAMVFLTHDVLELTSSLVWYRNAVDELGRGNKVNFKIHDEEETSYLGSLKSIKTWIPSRVGSVGIVFIVAPLLSFNLFYFISLAAVSIRLLWFLRTYFKS